MPEKITPELLERRLKRAERREKQRRENVGRALKMHDLRIKSLEQSISKPDFEFPRYNVGCSGWFYWHWKNIFYPENMPTSLWFKHYSKQFNTVELNAPFYSWPTRATVESWIRQANEEEFVYTVKVNELITHIKHFTRTKELVKDFGFIAEILGNRLGCFLFQLPPSYHYTPARLKNILSQMDSTKRNVVEFRHPSWWNEGVFEAFRKSGIIFCSCSGPKMPDKLIKTADDVYIRFHGTKKWYRHDYSKNELAIWVARIRDSGAKRIWAYFNNDRDGYAIKNAAEFLAQLKQE
jgi:uncharacterized protein YecE (DUF72 family)